MTTRSLEDLDGGLGSCLPSDDLPLLEELHSGRRPGSKAQDAVAGEVVVAAPQQWVPPSVPPKKPEVSLLKPLLSVPPSGPPEPKSGPPGAQALQQDKSEATEGSEQEASGEKRAPLGDRGSQERLQKEKPRKGEKLKKEKPRRDKPMTDERPRATREPRQSLPRRWTRDSRELKHEKRQTWALRRRHDGDDRSRQKPHGGKGRD
ncbi:junctional sarcoplasmic reticulum protein 1 [Cricetulus griseus]